MPGMSPRDFALEIVRRLRAAGHDAVWAGGCVRDALLGLEPKDYDVATSAPPEEVRKIFGRRRTLAIGQAFGVIAVLGPKSAGHVEVATFRKDLGYSDGRHPDGVAFCSAEEDARRRDFTINGMFFDPTTNQPIDYVGGRHDLEHRILCAIGDPNQRFDEDKLRMLRAVRFAATYDLTVDPKTMSAIQSRAWEVLIVSGERIGNELRRMLTHGNSAAAFRLLEESRLLGVVLPEFRCDAPRADRSHETMAILASLSITAASDQKIASELALPLAALLRGIGRSTVADAIAAIRNRWKLTNRESTLTAWLLDHETLVTKARNQHWPTLQRLLIHPDIEFLLAYATAVAEGTDRNFDGVSYCREQVALPESVLNPPPLLNGNELRALGVPSGPIYRTILDGVRDAQLMGEIADREAAVQWVQRNLR